MCSANMGEAGLQPRAPAPAPRVRAPAAPSGSAAARAAQPRGQPDRLTPPRATAELEAGQSELGQQMGPPAAVEGSGGGFTICRASPGGATGQEGLALLPTHPWGETLAGLLSQELREAAPGCGGVLEFSPGVLGGGCGLWSLRTGYTVGLELGVYGFRPWRVSHLPDSEAEREGWAE